MSKGSSKSSKRPKPPSDSPGSNALREHASNSELGGSSEGGGDNSFRRQLFNDNDNKMDCSSRHSDSSDSDYPSVSLLDLLLDANGDMVRQRVLMDAMVLKEGTKFDVCEEDVLLVMVKTLPNQCQKYQQQFHDKDVFEPEKLW